MELREKLICKILSYVASCAPGEPVPIPEIKGYPQADVEFHVVLCQDAEWLILAQAEGFQEFKQSLRIERITYKGLCELRRLRGRR